MGNTQDQGVEYDASANVTLGELCTLIDVTRTLAATVFAFRPEQLGVLTYDLDVLDPRVEVQELPPTAEESAFDAAVEAEVQQRMAAYEQEVKAAADARIAATQAAAAATTGDAGGASYPDGSTEGAAATSSTSSSASSGGSSSTRSSGGSSRKRSRSSTSGRAK